jgi:hypothetical protein
LPESSSFLARLAQIASKQKAGKSKRCSDRVVRSFLADYWAFHTSGLSVFPTSGLFPNFNFGIVKTFVPFNSKTWYYG